LAKSRYSQELAERICDAIATEGGDESGWIAGGISKATFYKWFSDFPDFRDKVERSRAEFRTNAPTHQRRAAAQKLTETLEHGQTVRWKKHISEKTMTRYKGDSKKGRILYTDVFSAYEEDNVETRPTPNWAIERVLPKPLNTLEQLLAAASEYGLTLVVKDADLFNRYLAEVGSQDNKGQSRSGLTEEAADEIRRRILGVEEKSTIASAVPSEMGGG
jgi:hypothetical protein